MSDVRLTQIMTLHLNGGPDFSELHYDILANGKKTGVTRHKRTSGSPRYRITADEFHHGEDMFDFIDGVAGKRLTYKALIA